MNLKEVVITFDCNVAGYKADQIDKSDLLRYLEHQLKAYVGGKDIGIMGNPRLTIESKQNGD
jgi:hypothetical protein